MLLSACLIVKDEAWTLRRCLDSLQDVVDEIIVVDTGSTDETVDIAKEYGARICTYEWDNHFANARNEALRHAQGDFILIIDADEYLDAAQKQDLRAFLSSTDAEGILVSIQNYIGSISRMDTSTPVTLLRIFRRGHKFTGAIHEQVFPSVVQTGKPIVKFDLTFHHVGYLHEFVTGRNKAERNMQILESELAENENNFYHLTNMMVEYRRVGEYAKCVHLAKKCYEKIKEDASLPTHLIARVMTILTNSLLQLDELDEAETYAVETMNMLPQLVDAHRGHAMVLLAKNHAWEAVQVLMKCREMGDLQEALTDTLQGSGTYRAAADLGQAWAKLGDDVTARKWYLQSFYEHPRLEEIIPHLLYLLPLSPEQLKLQVEDRIDDWVVLGAYALSYAMLGYQDSESVIARAVAKFGVGEYTQRARMAVAALRGRAAVEDEAASQASELSSYLLGLYLLNEDSQDAALAALQEAGARGHHVLELVQRANQGRTFQIGSVVHDLILLRASEILKQWLPLAADRSKFWLSVKHSPQSQVLSSVQWEGQSGWESEYNLQRAFKNADMATAIEWLEHAMSYTPTVSKVLLEADIALAHQNVQHAQQVLYAAQQLFPDSELLQSAIRNVGTVDSLESGSELEGSLDSTSSTMRMVQLHEQGGLLAAELCKFSQEANVNAVRECIGKLQWVIEACRALLNVTGEEGQMADKTYEFYYDLSFKWYLQPNCLEAEGEALCNFWRTWADTWRQVKESPMYSSL